MSLVPPRDQPFETIHGSLRVRHMLPLSVMFERATFRWVDAAHSLDGIARWAYPDTIGDNGRTGGAARFQSLDGAPEHLAGDWQKLSLDESVILQHEYARVLPLMLAVPDA